MTNLSSLYKKGTLKSFVSDNLLLFISCAVFMTGLILGAFAISLCSGAGFYGIGDFIKNSVKARLSQSFFETFGYSLLSTAPWLIALFILGNCSFGIFLCMFVPLFRGFCICLISGFLYNTYALYGIGFFALILFPSYFISSLVLIVSCAESFHFSAKYFSLLSSAKHNLLIFASFRRFSIKFGILFGILIISSLVDSVLSVCFIRFFSL